MSKNARKVHLTAGAAEVKDVAIRICTPYQKSLDQLHFASSGQEAPSVNFTPFQIFLASLAQQCWRQLYDGTMKRADGTPVHNINTLIANREQALDEYVKEKYEGDFTLAEGDPAVLRMATTIEQMDAQREMVEEFLVGFKEAYKHFFKKEWEPYIASSSTGSTAPATKAKEALAAAAARIAARRAKQEAAA